MSAVCEWSPLRGRWPLAALAVAGIAGVAGCGEAKVPKQRTIIVRHDPVQIVRDQLGRYVRGEALDSERDLFPAWVADIRAADGDLADVVEKGLGQIQAAPRQAGRIAKTLLERLGPAPKP